MNVQAPSTDIEDKEAEDYLKGYVDQNTGERERTNKTFFINCSKCDVIGKAEASLDNHYLFEKDTCAWNVYYTFKCEKCGYKKNCEEIGPKGRKTYLKVSTSKDRERLVFKSEEATVNID